MIAWLVVVSAFASPVTQHASPVGPCEGAAVSAPPPESVRALAGAQLAAEEAVRRRSVPGDRGVLVRPRFVRTSLGLGGLEVYCAENTATSHGDILLVGFLAGKAYPLGGFQSAALIDAFAAAGGRLDRSEPGDSILIARLILWADPNGGTARMLEMSGHEQGTANIPPIQTEEGTPLSLRCAVIVSIRPGWAGSQEKSRYCFAFDADGALLGWARRSVQ